MKFTIEGVNQVQRYLQQLRDTEIPTAMRNALNDTGRDVIKREELEITRVFHMPTRLIRRPFTVERATKTKPTVIVRIKDDYGKGGTALPNTLLSHVPGEPATRRAKGMERSLRYGGFIGPNQFLVPSRAMRLNRFGNITGSTASKMLNDIGVHKRRSGFTSETKAPKVRYVWATIKGTTGIWLKSRLKSRKFSGALQMLVVNGAPSYGKRFHFHAVAESTVAKTLPRHAALAVQHAIDRRTR